MIHVNALILKGIAFRRWIAYKMETDPFWQTGAEVVFSGEKRKQLRLLSPISRLFSSSLFT
jgi:hypothetical protein